MPTYSPFDAKGSLVLEVICNDRSPCCSLVKLYAKMGLHRYNLLKGKNYQFVRVKKYHYRLIMAATSYFITLVAVDPSTSLLQTFQTRIDEGQLAAFVLKCNISRIRGETNKFDGGTCYFPGNMPEWPTEDPFDDGKRFYVLNNSEMQDNDWIRLYLELAVAKCTSDKKDPDLSNLKIVNVAIDIQDLNEGLNAKNATVYISYKDEARVGKDVDRIAIARRNFDERTGCFSLMGKHQSLEIIPKKGENQSEDDPCDDVDHIRRSFYEHTRCLSPKNQDLSAENKCKYQRVIRRLRVIKPWRFSSPRRWRPEPYRKSCCRCTPYLHKTRSI